MEPEALLKRGVKPVEEWLSSDEGPANPMALRRHPPRGIPIHRGVQGHRP